jgi:hypothetical protein
MSSPKTVAKCSDATTSRGIVAGQSNILRPLLVSLGFGLFAVSAANLPAQDSQEFRDLKARVEDLQIDRDSHELEVQRKTEEAKRQAEMEAVSVYPQQIPPLAQPDDGTDSLVKELRDLNDEIEQSRLDANFRRYQAALQARLAAMTPEQRAAYWEACRIAQDKAKADASKAAMEKEESICHEQIQLRKWSHQTEGGKTFMIGLFKERHLGDRKADVERAAKQIGARSYRLWGHHKWGNLEEVRVVFYK